MTTENLPLRVQTFKKMIKGNYVYVDKTDLVYKLVTSHDYYFLSRPRRFGKSLLLSTIKAYFEGKKEYFEGLKIANLEKEWKKYAVLRFDLNGIIYQDNEGIPIYLSALIEEYENIYKTAQRYKYTNGFKDYVIRFRRLIKAAYEETGREVVILIDEYEKPILDTIGDSELQNRHRGYLKPFYSVLKNMEEYIHFVLLTGVTRMGQLSIFSDLNNLRNISLDPEFATICGFTEEEIIQNFSPFISELSQKHGWNYNQALEQLREKYDGYRFTQEDKKVYNPFSLLNCFKDKQLNNYWFASGTPSFLVNILRRHGIHMDKLEGYEATRELLTEVDDNFSNPIPLLYQSGYLTIVGFEMDDKKQKYFLDFPNEEVLHGFFVSMVNCYLQDPKVNTILDQIVENIKKGETKDFILKICSLIMGIPFSPREKYEYFYRDAVAIICRILSLKVSVELKILTGEIDLVIDEDKFVYIIEFKVDESPDTALKQIYEKRYSAPFEGSKKKIIQIGINFTTNPRDYAYLVD